MLYETLKQDLKQAMIAKQVVQRDILRFVISQVKNKEIETQKELADDEIVKIIQKEIKQINETRAGFVASGDDAGVAQEDSKIETLSTYLPEMLSKEALLEILTTTIETLAIQEPKKQRGPIIGAIMGKYGATVDGSLLNDLINSL